MEVVIKMVIYNKGLSRDYSTDEGKKIFSLISKAETKFKVRRIIITDVMDNPLFMELWIERDRIGEGIPLEKIWDAMPERIIEVDAEIPEGHEFSVVIKPQNPGYQGTLRGWVEYEIIG